MIHHLIDRRIITLIQKYKYRKSVRNQVNKKEWSFYGEIVQIFQLFPFFGLQLFLTVINTVIQCMTKISC